MSKCFIDTNILVYMADSRDIAKREKAIIFFSKLIEENEVYISTQVLQELYNACTKKLKLDDLLAEKLVRQYFDLNVIQIDIPIIESAMEIHSKTQFSFWDSLILAAASESGCAVLYSEDLNHGQTVNGVKIVNPFI